MSAPTTNPPDPKPPKKKITPKRLPLEEEQLAVSWLHVSKKPEFAAIQSGKAFFLKIKVDWLIATPGLRKIITVTRRLRPCKNKFTPIPVDFSGHSLFYYYRRTGLNTATLKLREI